MSQHGRLHQDSSSSTKQHPHDTVADTGNDAASVRIASILLVNDSRSAMPRWHAHWGQAKQSQAQ